MNTTTQTELEAAAFRQLLAHLQAHTEVQNIDLMNLADFCRNCLAKWYLAAAEEQGITMDYESARTYVYGMPYSEWKDQFQLKATAEQMALFESKKAAKAQI
ncbi:DUF1244 domain-containing protein [methanotrophic endosymbiont of Bathymodiolus puteoserpentis (Logatchev)]|jgi:hypothetical protein|uniref:DUF1244 domain-containing protein n=1 Tax=methanotrophic endosymbiont of Bathymodiolus puteoserpentis (Logatchev) TaxID=343235 RepID=UPI0013C97223|nr:DUF1244 domain-containing protein [methanotrophic endosymbiont of Bathymodiolus puteoserpentis (Logatchev)]SHE21450.1 protein of unknown function DUF1244 [methanotrophic endosymbiont of Bathymodiolus puteoserpentis (Logatchev)]